jgi:hypothetical protein
VYPEDRVLVGVINRKRDLERAQHEHWYRVPEGRAPKGIYAEYIAFFLSKTFRELNGGIHYYARRTGIELAYRRDLLPEEPNHPRAGARYCKLQLGELRRKAPPILNPTRRPISFIYTTWDRFSQATVIADLYSEADRYVDRVFHALEQSGIRPEQVWEASRASDDGGAQLRIVCEDGTVIASTAARGERVIPLNVDRSPDAVQVSVKLILEAIRQCGGPLMVNVPLEE